VRRDSTGAPLVLIIDDVADNREVYEEFLQQQGLRVVSAVDGQDGLAKAAALKPSVVVLDHGLPRLDGWEVAKRLKSAPATSQIPVIALTGHVTQDARDRAKAAGVDEFCPKPCQPLELIAVIRRYLA
jgi:CheY-like chemotaxis protein